LQVEAGHADVPVPPVAEPIRDPVGDAADAPRRDV
jgi:hypothetical protein